MAKGGKVLRSAFFVSVTWSGKALSGVGKKDRETPAPHRELLEEITVCFDTDITAGFNFIQTKIIDNICPIEHFDIQSDPDKLNL